MEINNSVTAGDISVTSILYANPLVRKYHVHGNAELSGSGGAITLDEFNEDCGLRDFSDDVTAADRNVTRLISSISSTWNDIRIAVYDESSWSEVEPKVSEWASRQLGKRAVMSRYVQISSEYPSAWLDVENV